MAKVILPSGKNVEIDNIIINKEQKLNVSKTYMTTVDEAVERVSDKFYTVKKAAQEADIFKTLPVDEINEEKIPSVEPALEMSMPELKIEEPAPEENVASVIDETKELDLPKELDVTPVLEKEPEVLVKTEDVVSAVTVPEPAPVEVKEEVVEEPKLVIPSVTPVGMVKPVEPEVKEEVKSEELAEAMNVASQDSIPEPQEEKVEPAFEQVVPTPIVQIKQEAAPQPKLLFDGADESNLNKALGEVSEEKVVAAPQEGVESIREFGTDTPAAPQPEQEVEDVKKLTRSRGFANNKFFMAIAIIFFLSACVFLGYEVFQYFQLK